MTWAQAIFSRYSIDPVSLLQYADSASDNSHGFIDISQVTFIVDLILTLTFTCQYLQHVPERLTYCLNSHLQQNNFSSIYMKYRESVLVP